MHAQVRRAARATVPRERAPVSERQVPNVERERDAALRAPPLRSLVPSERDIDRAAPASRDPATVVNWLRARPVGPLPRRDAVEHILGRPLGEVEVATGAAARIACDVLGARAFAAGNLIAFAAPSPTLVQILHEAAHVLQQSARLPRSPLANGTLSISRTTDRAEREAMTIASGGSAATLAPAPLAVYRDGEGAIPVNVDTTEEILRKAEPDGRLPVSKKRLLEFLNFDTWKMIGPLKGTERKFGVERAIVGIRKPDDKKQFDPWFQESSKDAFQRADYRKAFTTPLSDQQGKDDLEAARSDANLKKVGWIVGGKPTRLAIVGEVDKSGVPLTEIRTHILIGRTNTNTLATFERVQEVAASGNEKEPDEILTDIIGMVGELYEVAAGNRKWPAKATPLDRTKFEQVKSDANDGITKFRAKTITRAAAFDLGSTIRDNLRSAIISNYLENVDEFHDHIVESEVFKNPYQGIKGEIWEQYIPQKFPNLPKLDTLHQPVFGQLERASFIKSELLLKVRKGDGAIFSKADDDNVIDAKIIEAKAYKADSGPGTDEILQMQDYAKIIDGKIPGYVRRKDDSTLLDFGGVKTLIFTKVYYKFTSKPTAAAWAPALDAHLTGKYISDPDVGSPASDEDTLKAYQAALKALIPLAKQSKHASLEAEVKPVRDRIDKALAAPGQPADLVAKEVEAIRIEMIAAIAKAYDEDIDALYRNALTGVVFGAPHLAVNGLIFEKWLKDKRSGWPADALQAPLRGAVVKLRPIFTRSKVGATSTFGSGSNDLEVEYETSNGIIVIDRRASTGVAAIAPTTAERTMMSDAAALITSEAQGYLQVKQGSTNRAVTFSLKRMRFHFNDVTHAELWKDAYQKLNVPRDVQPDPEGKKEFDAKVSGSPEFSFHIDNADLLEHTIPRDKITQPKGTGAAAEEITVKLRAQRSPELESGSMKISIGAKDVVTQPTPAVKPILPTPLDPNAKLKATVLRGKFENKVGGLKSKLDDFLKRVETDAKLVPGGIEASLRITPGPSGIPNVLLDEAVIIARYVNDQLSISGAVGLKHASGKISGDLRFSYDKAIRVSGSITLDQIIDGLDKFTATVEYDAPTADKPEALRFKGDKASIRRKIGGVTLGGSVSAIVYDAKAARLSGKVDKLTADFGPFGEVEGTATIRDNQLTDATIDYTTPRLSYPKANPYVTGTVTGGFTYKDGNFGGGLTGDGKIDIKALKAIAPDGLRVSVAASVDAAGRFSGKFTAKDLRFGKYVNVPLIELTLRPDGEVEGTFGVEIQNIPHVRTITAMVSVTPTGITLEEFSVTGEIPKNSEKQRFWGSLLVAYKRNGALTITIQAFLNVRDGIVVQGTLTYVYVNGRDFVGGELTTEKNIVLLDRQKDIELVKPIVKQIPVISVYGIGLYIEFGVGVTFVVTFKLSLKPTVKLENFSLDDLSFDSITATMALTGAIVAALTVEPRVGLGLFVLSPSILRAGGGLKIPITATASVEAGAPITVMYYKPKDAGTNLDAPYQLSAAAQISLAIMFGIDVAIKPYANFVVLDGAFKKEWSPDDPLAKFQILAPRELFRYTVDFGKGVKPNDDPKLGDNPEARPKLGAVEPAPKLPPARDTKVDETVPDNPPKLDQKPPETAPENEKGGFSLATLLEKVKENRTYKAIKEVLDSVTGAFDKIGKFINDAIKFIRKWVGDAIDEVAAALKQISEIGFFPYVKQLLGEKLNAISPDLWEIVEPLLSALASSEDVLRDTIFAAFDQELPTGPLEALEWAFNMMTLLFGGAWDSITSFGKGLLKMGEKLVTVAPRALRRFIDKLIDAGMLGAKQSDPWAYKVKIGSAMTFSGETTSRLSATYPAAKALSLALSTIGATHKGGDENYWVDT